MARYTELLSEYLEGGGLLPASFDTIEGFTDLFKLHYLDKEIGFETETLFAAKLEEYATILIPLYKERIEMHAAAITNAKNPARTHYEKYNTTINAGPQRSTVTDLPFNTSTDITPSTINNVDSFTNTDERITESQDTDLDTTSAYYVLDKLNEKVHSIILDLLKEFKILFMQVYL